MGTVEARQTRASVSDSTGRDELSSWAYLVPGKDLDSPAVVHDHLTPFTSIHDPLAINLSACAKSGRAN